MFLRGWDLSSICHILGAWHGRMYFPSLNHGSSSIKGAWNSKVPNLNLEWGQLGIQQLRLPGWDRAGVGWWERGMVTRTWASLERKPKEVWSGGWRGQQGSPRSGSQARSGSGQAARFEEWHQCVARGRWGWTGVRAQAKWARGQDGMSVLNKVPECKAGLSQNPLPTT